MLRNYNRSRLDDRAVTELIGLCHGAIADGVVTREEAQYLEQWLARNTYIAENPVMVILLRRVSLMLSDGILDNEESAELMELMMELVGGPHEMGEVVKSSSLPLCNPQPEIVIPGSSFCFTGTFAFGTRHECESVIEQLGGRAGGLTKKTNFLVIGHYATDAWIQSAYGRKIEKACTMRGEGGRIAIISEEHWLQYMD